MKVRLQSLEGIESITIKTSDGKDIYLVKGQPVVIEDHNRQLIATIQRMPVDVVEPPEGGETPARGGQTQRPG